MHTRCRPDGTNRLSSVPSLLLLQSRTIFHVICHGTQSFAGIANLALASLLRPFFVTGIRDRNMNPTARESLSRQWPRPRKQVRYGNSQQSSTNRAKKQIGVVAAFVETDWLEEINDSRLLACSHLGSPAFTSRLELPTTMVKRMHCRSFWSVLLYCRSMQISFFFHLFCQNRRCYQCYL